MLGDCHRRDGREPVPIEATVVIALVQVEI